MIAALLLSVNTVCVSQYIVLHRGKSCSCQIQSFTGSVGGLSTCIASIAAVPQSRYAWPAVTEGPGLAALAIVEQATLAVAVRRVSFRNCLSVELSCQVTLDISRTPYEFSMGLPEISRVTWHLCLSIKLAKLPRHPTNIKRQDNVIIAERLRTFVWPASAFTTEDIRKA